MGIICAFIILGCLSASVNMQDDNIVIATTANSSAQQVPNLSTTISIDEETETTVVSVINAEDKERGIFNRPTKAPPEIIPTSIISYYTTPQQLNLPANSKIEKTYNGFNTAFVKSKSINFYNNNFVVIQQLEFNYEPGAVFKAGDTEEISYKGITIPYLNKDELPDFHGVDVVLNLGNISVYDLEWFGVWSNPKNYSLGDILLFSNESKYYENDPFNQSPEILYSGPIFTIDDKTFFITNLHYESNEPDVHFWAGKSNETNVNGFKVFDEITNKSSLEKYNGFDVYIRLPENKNGKDIDYLGVWSNKNKTFYGITKTPFLNLGTLTNHKYDDKGNVIARIPRCCPLNTYKTSKGCKPFREKIAHPLDVYDSNSTYFDDTPIKNVVYEPYLYKPNCEQGMYALDLEDDFYYLNSGVLLLDSEMISKDKFCIDISPYLEEKSDVPFICFHEEPNNSLQFNELYAGLIYTSSVFLIISSLIFAFVQKARSLRGLNVLGYTSSMAMSFICLATAKLLQPSQDTCIILGFVYQFFLVFAFTCLACMTYDTYYKIRRNLSRNFTDAFNKRRKYWYIGIVTLVPITTVLVSYLFSDKIPDNLYNPVYTDQKSCAFRTHKKVILYYIPILLSILINIIFNVLTWVKIKVYKKTKEPVWQRAGTDLKHVFRSNYMILIIMTICWIAEVISHFFETNNGIWLAIDIISSLQGVFVFFVLIFHNPVYEILLYQCKRCRKDREQPPVYTEYDSCPMGFVKEHDSIPPNHMHLLGDIRYADSFDELPDSAFE